MADENKPVIAFYPMDEIPSDEGDLRQMMATLAEAAMKNFLGDTQEEQLKAAAKFAAGGLAGGAVAKAFGSLTPLQWILKGFGRIPSQYLAYRATPVLQFTYKQGLVQTYRGLGRFLGGNGARILLAELSFGQRLASVAKVGGAKAVLVAIAFGGGYYVGTLINEEALDEDAQFLIGGTINQIVNEGGWRLALPDVMRESLGIAAFSPSIDLSEM